MIISANTRNNTRNYSDELKLFGVLVQRNAVNNIKSLHDINFYGQIKSLDKDENEDKHSYCVSI